jgi:hypothetical protein
MTIDENTVAISTVLERKARLFKAHIKFLFFNFSCTGAASKGKYVFVYSMRTNISSILLCLHMALHGYAF